MIIILLLLINSKNGISYYPISKTISILYICFIFDTTLILRVIKSRRMRWAWHEAPIREGRGVYRVLVEKPEGKRPLGRSRHRWEDSIKMNLQEVGCESMEWIEQAQNRDRWRVLVNAVMSHRVS
jgi:hypothetical protein